MADKNQYLVTWTSDIWADSPKGAAEEARSQIADPDSIAHIFRVFDGDHSQEIDLDEGLKDDLRLIRKYDQN